MKPLTRPPMKPMANSASAVVQVMSMKALASISATARAARLHAEGVPELAGKGTVYEGEYQGDADRKQRGHHPGLGTERHHPFGIQEQERVEADAEDAEPGGAVSRPFCSRGHGCARREYPWYLRLMAGRLTPARHPEWSDCRRGRCRIAHRPGDLIQCNRAFSPFRITRCYPRNKTLGQSISRSIDHGHSRGVILPAEGGPMALIRAQLAVSVDGRIADARGGVGWLEPFPAEDFGLQEFLNGIGTLVMGRATYDQMQGFGPWPHGKKHTLVLTTRALGSAPAGVEAVRPVDLGAAVAVLRGETGGDVWVVGGQRTLAAMLAADALDRLEPYLIPVLVGDGIPLFGPDTLPRRLDAIHATTLATGVVRLVYAVR
ncbi:MAG: hypothetical protein EXQ96_08135 [Alphaproteobacteria bacterium]|nr:hypothetical protein [Alphaproteobacteria bacterium]